MLLYNEYAVNWHPYRPNLTALSLCMKSQDTAIQSWDSSNWGTHVTCAFSDKTPEELVPIINTNAFLANPLHTTIKAINPVTLCMGILRDNAAKTLSSNLAVAYNFCPYQSTEFQKCVENLYIAGGAPLNTNNKRIEPLAVTNTPQGGSLVIESSVKDAEAVARNRYGHQRTAEVKSAMIWFSFLSTSTSSGAYGATIIDPYGSYANSENIILVASVGSDDSADIQFANTLFEKDDFMFWPTLRLDNPSELTLAV